MKTKKWSKPLAALTLSLLMMFSLCLPAQAVINGDGHDENLTPAQQEEINQATKDYEAAHELPPGEERWAAEKAAHDKAEAARKEGGNYSGGTDGTEYHPLPSDGGGSYYTPTTFTITASAGTGGNISPSGSTSVTSSSSQTYAITAISGYKISDVKVDGSSIGAASTYSFSNVSSAHTISATFTSAASLSAGSITLGDNGSGTLKSGNVTKSGYGVTASLPVTSSYISGTTVTASYNFTSDKTVSLEYFNGTWQFPVNSSSVTNARKIYIPLDTPDGTYTITFTIKALDSQATVLAGRNVYLTATKTITITINGSMYDDDATGDS